MNAPVPDKFRRIRVEDSYETHWILVGPQGAVDFHCTNLDRIRVGSGMHDLWRSGGVEYHHRAVPDYMTRKEASHEHCWILEGPCWYAGTSLWASEHWIPLLERDGEDGIWSELTTTYARHDWPAATESLPAAPAGEKTK